MNIILLYSCQSLFDIYDCSLTRPSKKCEAYLDCYTNNGWLYFSNVTNFTIFFLGGSIIFLYINFGKPLPELKIFKNYASEEI
jgi:hypothetical protein